MQQTLGLESLSLATCDLEGWPAVCGGGLAVFSLRTLHLLTRARVVAGAQTAWCSRSSVLPDSRKQLIRSRPLGVSRGTDAAAETA